MVIVCLLSFLQKPHLVCFGLYACLYSNYGQEIELFLKFLWIYFENLPKLLETLAGL